MLRQFAAGLALSLALIVATPVIEAQDTDHYTARLGWVPIGGAERNDVSGRGSAQATLVRSRLSITGEFEGLPARATIATLRQGAATGARGPVIAELAITNAADGTFSADVDLNRNQRAALLAGQLYVQVHAERGVPPDNAVLWGWLLPASSSASSGLRGSN